MSARDPWEDWLGLEDRIENRYWDEEIAFAVTLGEIA